MYDIIVIGGGPAALSAASYALGKQLSIALVYESLGGKVGWRHSLADLDEDRRLPGSEVVRLLTMRTTSSASDVIEDRVLSISKEDERFLVSTEGHGILTGTAVIVATGATPLRLNVPGAQHFVRHGLGYSIRTFGHLVAAKRVAVIGATARALRGAAELARLAAHVYVIAPSAESMTSPLVCALRRQPNVTVLEGYEVIEVIGIVSIAGLRVAHNNGPQMLAIDQAFVDLGLVPNSDLVRAITTIDAHGFIVVDHLNATTTPGLFAAGDVTTNPGEQVLVAVGDGAQAAVSAYDYLLAQWLMPRHSVEVAALA